MKIREFYEGLSMERREHWLMMKLGKPHRVLSTCRVNGGLMEQAKCLLNHQICEPKNDHASPNGKLAMKDMVSYHQKVAEDNGFRSGEVALFSTAASMNNAGMSHERDGEVEVVAVVTAGVETNAGCVGDPAGYKETPEGFVRFDVKNNLGPGTIVTMVFINQELLPGAMVVASTVATEAKTAVLRDLNVGSNYSEKLATGTGTDQIGIACQTGGSYVYRDAGKHSQLGELIGKTVSNALYKALLLQNGMSPISQRKLTVGLKRFAITETKLIEGVATLLEGEVKDRWENNWITPIHDVFVSSAVNGLIHLWDMAENGIYSEDYCWEIHLNHAALICCAVASKYESYYCYRKQLADTLKQKDSLFDLVCGAIAIGYQTKW